MAKSRAEYQRNYRERKKVEKALADSAPAIDTESQENPELQVDVVDPVEAPKLSLKDRILGFAKNDAQPAKATKSKRGARGKQIDANLMSEIFPTMVAGSIALYAQKLIKNPYKACAPTQREVVGTVGPLFSILGRRIQIVGQASEDIIDLINALLSSLVTGIRMHITFLTIQEQIEVQKQNGHDSNARATAGRYRSIGVQTRNEVDTSREIDRSNGYPSQSTADIGDGSTDIPDGNNEHANPETNLFAGLFSRDTVGRQQLGLLPR